MFNNFIYKFFPWYLSPVALFVCVQLQNSSTKNIEKDCQKYGDMYFGGGGCGAKKKRWNFEIGDSGVSWWNPAIRCRCLSSLWVCWASELIAMGLMWDIGVSHTFLYAVFFSPGLHQPPRQDLAPIHAFEEGFSLALESSLTIKHNADRLRWLVGRHPSLMGKGFGKGWWLLVFFGVFFPTWSQGQLVLEESLAPVAFKALQHFF